jgi:hypothetical protein
MAHRSSQLCSSSSCYTCSWTYPSPLFQRLMRTVMNVGVMLTYFDCQLASSEERRDAPIGAEVYTSDRDDLNVVPAGYVAVLAVLVRRTAVCPRAVASAKSSFSKFAYHEVAPFACFHSTPNSVLQSCRCRRLLQCPSPSLPSLRVLHSPWRRRIGSVALLRVVQNNCSESASPPINTNGIKH